MKPNDYQYSSRLSLHSQDLSLVRSRRQTRGFVDHRTICHLDAGEILTIAYL